MGGGAGERLCRGTWPKMVGGNFQMENTHLSLSVSFTKQTQGHSDKDRKLLLLARQVELCITLVKLGE